MIWLVFAFLTAVAVLAVLWPLLRTPRTVARQEADVAFYEAQIAEIGRDAERGLIAAEDAASAKAEAARRLIAVGDEEQRPSGPQPRTADAAARSARRAARLRQASPSSSSRSSLSACTGSSEIRTCPTNP